MICTHYSDHEDAPLSQMRTVGLCGYTVYNSPSLVLYCHLLAQLCNLENNLFYIVIMRKIRRDNEENNLCYVEITRKLNRDHEKTTFILRPRIIFFLKK